MQSDVIQGFRLSPQQKRLWSLQRDGKDQPYRAQCAVMIRGRLENAHMRIAIEQAVRGQEILRTSFRRLPGMTIPLQVIGESCRFQLTHYDWQELSPEDRATSLDKLWNEAQQAPFDLEQNGQLQLWLAGLGKEEHTLIVSLPAMYADAAGLCNLVAEISRCYEASIHGKTLADAPMQYADISEWQNELLEVEDGDAGRTYWHQQDISSIATFKLPYQREVYETGRAPSQLLSHTLSPILVQRIEALVGKYETSASVVLLTCWHILLGRLTARTSTVIGTALNGRKHKVLEGALGLLTKYLPIECALEAGSLFGDLLRQQQARVRKANIWQEKFSWESLNNETEGMTEDPFFPFCFDYDERPASYAAGEVTFSIYRQYVCTERFHVQLSCVRSGAELSAEFHYDSALYNAADMSRLASEFQTLIESVADYHDEVRIGELEIVGEAERQQLLVQWNDSATSYSHDECIHKLFERQAAQTPTSVALVYEGQQLNYGELNGRANQLAHHLRRLAVGAEVQVGLCVERSLEMIVGVLGILKAGGAYVPLDPTYPRERLGFMLGDSGAPVLLTQQHLLDSLPPHQAQVVCLDTQWDEIGQASSDNSGTNVQVQNLAYVIYTSGSTGTPKGVLVTHQNLVHSTAARTAYYRNPPSRFLLLSSFAFDSSVAGIFWTLCGGGTLVLPAEGLQRDVQVLVRAVQEQAVSHLLSLPSLHASMLEVAHDGELAALQVVIVAGEVCRAELVEQHWKFMAETKLYNEYGPTEASVWSTVHECGQVLDGRSISIGRVISNAQVYILDDELRPVAIGVAGELYLGGDGITRGYLHHAEITAEKFIPNLFSKEQGTRLYRTGDLGRYLADGKIEFLGRIDSQVKIRGYRIELGEIETILGAHPAVDTAVVVVREGGAGDQQIVAYAVSGAEATSGELRDYLRERVPPYMVPTWVVMLDQMPLMANGKIDRQALPAPERVALEGEVNAPRTPIEEVLAGIWSEVLGAGDLSVTANFFELGGHSLLATQVMSRVREAFGIELPVRSLFSAPTVRELAEIVEQELRERHGLAAPPLQRVGRASELPLSYAQQRLWFADQLRPDSALYNVAFAVRLSGPLNIDALEQTLTEVIRRHEVLRTSFPAQQGKPVQVIAPAENFRLLVSDLSGAEATEGEQAARLEAQSEAEQSFDLASGPLLRARLLKLGAEEHVALFTMHHIVSDGWSMGVLIREVSVLYEAYSRGEESPLAELAIQYADYAVWQREWLKDEVLERQLGYWREQLRGAPAVLALPTDTLRPAVQSFRGAQQAFSLTPELSAQLKVLSRSEGVTLFMTLLAAFKTLLYFYSKQDDIVVGIDIANRNRIEVEALIGFFINILIMRSNLSGNPTFRELLGKVRETILGAYAHQDLPFERLVEELQPERSLSGMPLVQVMLSFQNAPQSELLLSDVIFSPFQSNSHTAKRDLTLFITETKQGLVGSWNYNSDLFKPGTIKRMSSYFEKLMAQVAGQPDIRLDAALELLAEADREQKAVDKKERRDSKLKQLMNVAPKSVRLSQDNLIRTGYLTSGQTMPLVVQPALNDVDLTQWVKSQLEFIEAKLSEHGAILFRGFSPESALEFEQFVLSICPELFGEYGDLPREGVSGQVYGSTPYPAEQAILFHNESSHLRWWPMKIWFFCMRAAQQGGETPIVDCRKVYEALAPEIRERFEKKKVMYVRNYMDGLDVSWQQFFRTSDKSRVEDYCRKASIAFEWKAGNSLRTHQVCQAVLRHPKTGETVFFNQLQAHHVSCLDSATRESLLALLKEEDLPRNVYYGDGSLIEDSVIDEVRGVYQQLAINFPWQKTDILMLDNMLTAHGRNPYTGERKIVVAMGEMISNQTMATNGRNN
jgi:amino acid adenylation domain-containing protein